MLMKKYLDVTNNIRNNKQKNEKRKNICIKISFDC